MLQRYAKFPRETELLPYTFKLYSQALGGPKSFPWWDHWAWFKGCHHWWIYRSLPVLFLLHTPGLSYYEASSDSKSIVCMRTNCVFCFAGLWEKTVDLFLGHGKPRLLRSTGADYQNEFQHRKEGLVVRETEKDRAGYCQRCSPSTFITSCICCLSLSYICHHFI